MLDNSVLIRWLPTVCLGLLIVIVLFTKPFKPGVQPDPPTKPVLALELPGDGEVQKLLSTTEARTTATANTEWDYWFIGGYALLFLSVALLYRVPLRIFLMAVAVGTAAFDVWEDAIIMRFIANPDTAVARSIWLPARGKWLCFFIAVALIAPLFVRAAKWWWVMASLLTVCGLIGAAGALLGKRVMIDRITGPTIVALSAAVLLLPAVSRRAPPN